jgi:hypothetical protein
MYSEYNREYLEVIFMCLSSLLLSDQLDKLDEILTTTNFNVFVTTALDMIAGDA